MQYDDGTAIDGTEEIRRQGPREVVPDAYAEHVRALHEDDDREKTCTLKLEEEQMRAVFLVLSDALRQTQELAPEHKRKWDSIMRSIGRSLVEAK